MRNRSVSDAVLYGSTRPKPNQLTAAAEGQWPRWLSGRWIVLRLLTFAFLEIGLVAAITLMFAMIARALGVGG